MFTNDVKVAFRNFLKYKTQNLVSLAGLSVALLCFSICLYCSRYMFSTNDCFERKQQIAELKLYSPKSHSQVFYSGTPVDLLPIMRSIGYGNVESYCCVAYASERPFNVEVDTDKYLPYELVVMETDSAFQSVFTPDILCGSWETVAHTPNALVLSESTAIQIFKDVRSAIGKQMIMTRRLSTSPSSTPRTGGIVYTVQAVIADLPGNTSLNFLKKTDALVLNDSEGLFQSDRRMGMTGSFLFALLRSGTTVSDFAEYLQKQDLKYHIFDEDTSVTCEPLGTSFWKKSVAPYFAWVTLTAGVLILLAGLLNFFHLLIGTFLTRIREYSVRRVNGADFYNLFRMLFVQSALLIIMAGFLTFLLIELMSPFLQFQLITFSLEIDKETLMWQTLTYLLCILAVCALICAVVILRVRKITIHAGFFGGSVRYGRHRLRNILLGVQLFICWIFVSLTVALYLQAEKTGKTLLGTLSTEEKEVILSIPFDYTFMTNQQKKDIIDKISKLSGVEDILLADISYLNGISGNILYTERGNENSYVEVNIMSVGFNFFHFMNADILSGKTIETSNDMVIDSNLARRMDKGDILGMTLYNYNDGYTVRGVCEPFVANVYNESTGYVFLPSDFTVYIGHCYVKCIPDQFENVKKQVAGIMRQALPENIDYRPATLMDDIYEHQAIEFKLREIVLFFSLVSLVISLLGVYSAITLDTEYRRKEMAIRKINGASMFRIALVFARLYAWLLVSTALIAFPLVGLILHFFRRMYTVFFDCGFGFYLSIFLCVTLVIIVTVYFRIRRIVRVDPVEVIKNE